MQHSGPSLLLIEAGLTLVSIALAFCWPTAGSKICYKLGRGFVQFSRRRALSIFAVAASAGTLRLALLPLSPIPKPAIYDDFSYLLAADTFESGRLTNPTHPMWIHFESFHITQVPTYMSMYFPAQGFLLAAGKFFFGHPWYGILLTTSLMCGAFCWMLQAWLPSQWALLGGFFAVLRIGLFSYWIDQYWGGALPALAGALVLGAVPRIRRSHKTRDFFWMALGMALLALSRPYEGLLICVPLLAAVCWWIYKQRRPSLSVLALRIAPALLVLIGTLGFFAYYDYRLFGSPFTVPYEANRKMYASAPHFIWQSPRPEPVYRYAVMRTFYTDWELHWFEDIRTPAGFIGKTLKKIGIALLFYFGFLLLIPLAMLPRALRDRRMRFLVITGGIFSLGLFSETWLIPHYVAPFASGVYAILLQCMRHMRAGRTRGASAGLFLTRAIPVLCVLLTFMRAFAEPLKLGLPGPASLTLYGTAPLGLPRAKVLEWLQKQPGDQLAIVRYSKSHDIFDEWVYNAADIDHSKVVWARELDPAHDQQLIRYFHDRKVWLVEPDFNPPRISPYTQQLSSALCGQAAARVGSRVRTSK